ncbi:MAG: ABC transporter ATP-binding protein, partial [Spirochaetota bacterium]
RVPALRTADLIIVLDRGMITQRGTHAELLADGDGFYAEIAQLQELEAELSGTAAQLAVPDAQLSGTEA